MSRDIKQTYTLTFGNAAENHAGMQMLGKDIKNGCSINTLEKISQLFSNSKYTTEIVDLLPNLPETYRNTPCINYEAKLLIVRKGTVGLVGSIDELEKLFLETKHQEVDKQAWMKGKVVNKHARWNLCYDDFSQEPDYVNKKGRVINFSDVPYLNKVRKSLLDILKYTGVSIDNLVAEMNYYYDISKYGIGYHGDTERKIVVGIRLGDSMPLCYQWYFQGAPVGDKIILNLDHGDFYIMSEKAVGTDWKRRIIPTLRHAAGCSKYTNV